MPTLPKVRRENLEAARAGSLVSIAGHIFGLRAWNQEETGEKRPVFIHLIRDAGRIRAQILDVAGGLQITGNTRVVNHSDVWSLYVKADAWDVAEIEINFNAGCQGLLLLEEVESGSGLAMAVGVPWLRGDCCRLKFDDWTLEDARMSRYAVAKQWNVALPHANGDSEWPLGI